jgi:copper chaperone CopZ
VQAALAKVDGVENCKVNYSAGTVTVTTAAGTRTDALVKAFEGTKFTATVKK